MPRDDLTIDFVGTKGITMALTTDQPDCAAVLDDFTNRVANLPAEIAFMQEEIEVKDRAMEECRNIINKLDTKLQNHIREHGSLVKNPKEEAFIKTIRDNFTKCEILQAEKIELAKRAQLALDKHTINLDKQIKSLQDRGEFPNDADIPSMLRPVIPQQPRHPEPSTAMPLGPINNSATVVHTRHPNQHPMRPTPVPNQAQQMHGSGASTPVPGVAPHLNQRARETSLGASSKRQKLTGNLGPLPSGLSRPPLGPGTPKASTPASSRAGSIGPRASQKVGAKKVAPHRQGAIPPKRKPMKSSVNHLKRPRGNKNSPSSTNDSELSDAESASGDEEDEVITPPKRKDGEGDEDMDDIDDDEGGDNKKYCTCQSVSYGDMVACDNESCPYEWFHWSCVGLKSEPVGTWICPVCTKNMKRA